MSITLLLSGGALLGGLWWIVIYKRFLSLWEYVGWLLMLGGGLSNTLERLGFNCVHDNLPFIFGITNNPADWSLAIGGGILMLYYWHQNR